MSNKNKELKVKENDKIIRKNKTTSRVSNRVSKLLDEMPGEEKFQGISKINRFNILFVDLQVIFTIATIICFVWYIFNSKIWHILQFVLGITLIIIGYNNKIIYNRPKSCWIYYVIGIILIVLNILSMLGV